MPPSKLFKGVNKRKIIIGIEIKVSKSDFKNGFIQSGCTFNYLMIPKGLIKYLEVDKSIGIIEIDIKNLKVLKRRLINNYGIEGLYIIRKPKRNILSDITINSCEGQIGETLTNQCKRWLVEQLQEK